MLLGSYAVGKTSIVNRFMYEQFSREHEVTMGVDYFTKTISIDDTTVTVRIWDTAGQEQYQSLIPMYIRDTQVAIVVYDLSDERSFEAAQEWYARVIEARQNSVRVVLAGNKSDLAQKVPEAAVKKFADDHGLSAVSVSAKLGTGIPELFQIVVKEATAITPLSSARTEAVTVQALGAEEEPPSRCRC
jgi:small GTP-binding protein